MKMLVPGHVVSMYVATGGTSGQLLGSDEKEIVLLIYVVIDVSTAKVIGVQQHLVRPIHQIGKELNSTETSPITTPTDLVSPQLLTVAENAIISDSLLQVAGLPLNEVINAFDQYIRSLQIDPDSQNFRIITDGQLPLRQCLHPESCAKDIELPSYYCRFSDLRKEFVRYKSADLSKALIAVKDINKLPNMPSLPPLPLSIADMVKELEITTLANEDGGGNDNYMKESRDMVAVIQTMLGAGHKFEANEIINLTLEPGICSVDDEIDGSCIVRARGLPWQSSDQDIAKFFRGLNVAKGGVALCLTPQGRRNGEALVRFVSQEHRDMALKRHKHHIGNRYIEVYRGSGEDFLNVAGGTSNEAQAFLSKGAQVIIRMRGLPYDCTAKQILEFFTTGNDPCDVLDGTDGILFVKKLDGRATGDAFVLFATENDAPKALSRHRESIGQRYIELFRSTTAEVQQVLNRSLDPKTYEPILPPILAQLPSVHVPLLPQHIITSGTSKNCIRLRGLPYEASVEHILHFLEDFANNIIYQGVHMVYNAQGQPSGEAFIQMDSEEAARASALQKHNKYMVFGKKYRYIEVFQCSGDDMNMVLNGGLHSPGSTSKPALLSPGGALIGPAFRGFAPFAAPTPVLSPRVHHGFYPQPILYWGYPSPPVSPTTYYGHPAPPPPQPPQQQQQQHTTNATLTHLSTNGGGVGLPQQLPNLNHHQHQTTLFSTVDYILQQQQQQQHQQQHPLILIPQQQPHPANYYVTSPLSSLQQEQLPQHYQEQQQLHYHHHYYHHHHQQHKQQQLLQQQQQQQQQQQPHIIYRNTLYNNQYLQNSMPLHHQSIGVPFYSSSGNYSPSTIISQSPSPSISLVTTTASLSSPYSSCSSGSSSSSSSSDSSSASSSTSDSSSLSLTETQTSATAMEEQITNNTINKSIPTTTTTITTITSSPSMSPSPISTSPPPSPPLPTVNSDAQILTKQFVGIFTA